METYQCKQDCGISHSGNHGTLDCGAPGKEERYITHCNISPVQRDGAPNHPDLFHGVKGPLLNVDCHILNNLTAGFFCSFSRTLQKSSSSSTKQSPPPPPASNYRISHKEKLKHPQHCSPIPQNATAGRANVSAGTSTDLPHLRVNVEA